MERQTIKPGASFLRPVGCEGRGQKKTHFFLDIWMEFVMLGVQSESVTLSVDYLISSAQVGLTTCLGFSMPVISYVLMGYPEARIS